MAVFVACLVAVGLLGMTLGASPAQARDMSAREMPAVEQSSGQASPFQFAAVRSGRIFNLRRPTTTRTKPKADPNTAQTPAVEPPAAIPALPVPTGDAETNVAAPAGGSPAPTSAAGPLPAVSRTSPPAQPESPAASVKLVSRDRETELRRFLPKVADADLQAMLDDSRMIFYTDQEMPKAYQFFDGAFPGVHAVSYNISANDSEPFGNGNIEFPWGTPAGTHRSPGITTFRFFLLPKDDAGRTLPVAWYQPPDKSYAWIFPLGTMFGEVLGTTGTDGKYYTFELRTRRRETGDWAVDVFRPFPTAAHLSARIKELAPDWQDRPPLTKAIEHLEQPQKLPELVLADQQPGARPFQQKAGVDTLPSLEDDALVAKLLLTTTFRSAHGKVWRREAGVSTAAPTTLASFHVVPKFYDAGFVEVDQISCMRCHSTVNQSVNNFNAGRDWYGKVRGSDGIFSFHPFEPDSISYHGYSQEVRMRSELVNGKLLERFDPARHPNRLYHTLVR